MEAAEEVPTTLSKISWLKEGKAVLHSLYANMVVTLRWLLDPDGPLEWAFHTVLMHPRRATQGLHPVGGRYRSLGRVQLRVCN